MVDVTIKDVPEGAEESVKNMAMVAIERFLNSRDIKVAVEVTTKFEKDVDAIRIANSLTEKYAKPKVEDEKLII
jgi:hypothetical protein